LLVGQVNDINRQSKSVKIRWISLIRLPSRLAIVIAKRVVASAKAGIL